MQSLLSRIYSEIGITPAHLVACKLPICEQPPLATLEVVDIAFDGRPFVLKKVAAEAWRKMKASAEADKIGLEPISGFRSYIYQKQLIERKLSLGRPLETILTETAIPGFSEHHGGCAVDISSAGRFELTQDFEQTSAYEWLAESARKFGFELSYPRDNREGIIFEPWHWCFNLK